MSAEESEAVVRIATRVVRPEFRHRGISKALMRAVLARESAVLYVQCGHQWARYYERFGFRHVHPSGLPPDIRRQHRLTRIFVALRSIWVRRRLRIVAMKRDAPRNAPVGTGVKSEELQPLRGRG